MKDEGGTSGMLLYCITSREGPDPAAGPDLAGVGGHPVIVRQTGRLALWTEAVEQPVEPTPETILAHQAVVDRAWRTRPACLPVRYGQWFASPDEAVAAAEERLDRLVEALERVKDAVEYDLEVELREPDPDAPGRPEHGPDAGGCGDAGDAGRSPGRAYMEALRLRQGRAREADRRREEVLEALEAAVEDLVRARRPASRPERCGVAHLLARSAEGRYVERLRAERLRAARRPTPGVHVRLKGPWPPWSFGA